ncbi:hypothetical protein [Neorhodopirellula pilleata]|uniref:Uncharacterized protein n=1 Tax=Neorhodopirellula pilleata TaxID=2714738 RepID=A0A5C6A1D5_9BACT|nr:hypothetical protein [Neorhodopirellula pilleata]TWT93137.1 hypothetical protein Pla100_44540 [Neorhodopirellula pilleata]
MNSEVLRFSTHPSVSSGTRRGFLSRILAGGALASSWAAGWPDAGDASAGESSLRVNRGRDLFRVRMQIDVKGNVNLAKDPMIPDSPKQVLPITGKISLDYEERYLRPEGATAESAIIVAERHYHEATGTSTLNRTTQATQLRDSLDSILARREQLPETIYSGDDYLTHEEVELLRTPVASCAIDSLVPTKTLRVGEKIEVASMTLASVFNLTAIAASDVQMELVSADAADAKLQMRGKIEGSVAGVPTQLHVLGKLTLDSTLQTVTWAAFAVHETREIGNAEPGFDVTATIRMIRKPLAKPERLPLIAAKVDFDQSPPRDRLLMNIGSDYVGVNALMDRRWRIMKDAPGEAILRMIENDRSIAQLNLRPLPRLAEGEQWTIEAFELDVKRKLGDRFGEILQSQTDLTESGLRMLRVVATGQVQGVPIQWIMMHFSDDEQHRVVATLTMDGESVPKLDGADVQLAASLQLANPRGNVASGAGEHQSDEKSGQTGEKLGDTGSTRLESIASRPSDESSGEVSSASDIPVQR